jgi:hypothetical protein
MNGTDSKTELVTMEDSRLMLCLGGFSVRREVDLLCEIDCELDFLWLRRDRRLVNRLRFVVF